MPIDKMQFEEGLEEDKGGSLWIRLGKEIASGHKELSIARIQ